MSITASYRIRASRVGASPARPMAAGRGPRLSTMPSATFQHGFWPDGRVRAVSFLLPGLSASVTSHASVASLLKTRPAAALWAGGVRQSRVWLKTLTLPLEAAVTSRH